MPEKQLRIIRLRMFVITVILSCAILGAFILATWALESSHTQAVEQRKAICQATNNSNVVLRNILAFAEQIALKKATDPKQTHDIHAFYNHAFSLIPPIACSDGGTQ